jgi:hypothetical protein
MIMNQDQRLKSEGRKGKSNVVMIARSSISLGKPLPQAS